MPMIESPDAFLKGYRNIDETWTRVVVEYTWNWSKSPAAGGLIRQSPRREWIDANTTSYVMSANGAVYFFEDPKEAIMFKLVVDSL